jgi:uncharacterized protein YcfL
MKKISVIVALLMILACGANHDEHNNQPDNVTVEKTAALVTPDEFKASLNVALDAYFELKDALVATDAVLAAEKSAALSTALVAVSVDGLSAEAAMLWDVAGKDASAASIAIGSESDVEVQREYFEHLSNALIDMVKAYGPFENTIYRQTCPMVRDGSADWLSKEENIMNPYHGSRMLRCGSVVERI